MFPSIFGQMQNQDWDTFGNGVLADAISCIVEEERNGAYELEMEYPITGKYYDQLQLKNFITARPNYTDFAQPFRIYYISRPLKGIVTVRARHISYDLSGGFIKPFSANGMQAVLAQLKNNDALEPYACTYRFTFSSDITSNASVNVKLPTSIRSFMGGIRGSMLDVFGGEWHFAQNTCELLSARGQDRGVVIQYGKNLTALEQREEDEMYSSVVPYYYNEETDELVLCEAVSYSGLYLWSRAKLLDVTEWFDETPTSSEIWQKTRQYMDANDLRIPNVNLKLNFVQLDKYTDRVDLCDTVTIRYEDLGIDFQSKCVRTKWNVLLNRYDEIEIGSPRITLGDFFTEVKPVTEHYYVGAAGGGG